MQTMIHLRRQGFTLLEIMIVVAIIAMLAAIATSNMIRARKRAQAAKVIDDLRMIDGAIDQYAVENNKKEGDIAAFSDLQPYLKRMNKLNMLGADIFGQSFGPYSVDTPPKVSDVAFQSLSDVAPAEFWSPYK
ncbi:MAG TPA: prepilin-type N-terminal cleavage/methylation domain-containing protein [Chthoniobacter sp.]|nr:prepilin-type N-terminal cleavage/methylation domain-containing protein [Chthoniobacter sp.]